MNESINSNSSTKEQNKNEQFYSFQHENNEAVSDRKKKNLKRAKGRYSWSGGRDAIYTCCLPPRGRVTPTNTPS